LQPDNTLGTIKDLVEDKRSMLKELRKQKRARKKEFLDVLSQIHNISGEIAGFLNLNDDVPTVDEYDLSHKKLEGYKSWLQKLQNEKVIWLPSPILYQLVTGWKTPLISFTKQHIESFVAFLCLTGRKVTKVF
jgi:hypothetical protein